jgi:hypothetical protein
MAGIVGHRRIFTDSNEGKRQKQTYEAAQWFKLLIEVREFIQTSRRLTPGVYQIDPAVVLKLKMTSEKLVPLLSREPE